MLDIGVLSSGTVRQSDKPLSGATECGNIHLSICGQHREDPWQIGPEHVPRLGP